MSEYVNFANFSPTKPEASSVYDIGVDGAHEVGVIGEIALLYRHDLTDNPEVANLEALLGRIVMLQEVALVDKVVRDLNVSSSGLMAVQSWVARSALLKPARRMFDYTQSFPSAFDMAVVTSDNVRAVLNRTEHARTLWNERRLNFGSVLLVAGDLTLPEDKRHSTIMGSTVEEEDLLRQVARGFGFDGYRCAIYRRQPDRNGYGSDVEVYEEKSVVVISDSGRWIQDAGRLLRVFTHDTRGIFNITGGRFGVITDTEITYSDVRTLVTETNMVGYTLQIIEAATELQRHRQFALSRRTP